MIPAVKICGITSLTDAEAAIASGASYIGLIFADKSPRRISLDAAKEIARALRGRVKLVTVFQDSPVDLLVDHVSYLEPDLVQYHGSEPAELIATLKLPAIKVFQLDATFNWGMVRPYRKVVDKILVDRPKKGPCSDWLSMALDLVMTAPDDLPAFFFAGGLSPDNVGTVVGRLNGTCLHGLDVASGVEREPGQKDPAKIRDFCQAVREAAKACVR